MSGAHPERDWTQILRARIEQSPSSLDAVPDHEEAALLAELRKEGGQHYVETAMGLRGVAAWMVAADGELAEAESLLAHWSATRLLPSLDPLNKPAETVDEDEKRAVAALGKSGHYEFMDVLLAHLGPLGLKTAHSSTVPLLVRKGKKQRATDAWLTLRVVELDVPGLFPDPEQMLYTKLDERFQHSLSLVRAITPPSECVLWSVEEGGYAPKQLDGASASAAMAVALMDINRRGLLRRRQDPRCVITGELCSDRRMGRVDGYPEKLKLAAANKWRVVAPVGDEEKLPAPDHRLVKVKHAGDLDQAFRLSRAPWHAYVIGLSLALALLLLVASVLGQAATRVDEERASTRQASLRARSGELAEEAEALYRGEAAGGLGLLLALVSDELAREAGIDATALERAIHLRESLLASHHPPSGAYSGLEVSKVGHRGAASTRNPASAAVLDLATGETVAELVPAEDPNNLLAGGAGIVLSTTISEDGEVAAASTGDQRIMMAIGEDVFELGIGFMPDLVRTTRGPIDRHSAEHISVDRTNRWLYGAQYDMPRLAVFDLAAGTTEPTRFCDLPGLASSVSPSDFGHAFVVIEERQILDVSADDCSMSEITLDGDLNIQAISLVEGKPYVAGTNDGGLLAGFSDELVLLSGPGSYGAVEIGESDGQAMLVTAITPSGVVGWTADGRKWLELPDGGRALVTGQRVYWLHDGLIEVHSQDSGIGFLKTVYNRLPWDSVVGESAWLGNQHGLVLGTRRFILYHGADGSFAYYDSPDPRLPSLLDMSVHSAGRYVATSWSGPDSSDAIILALIDLETGAIDQYSDAPGLNGIVEFIGDSLFAGRWDSSVDQLAIQPEDGLVLDSRISIELTGVDGENDGRNIVASMEPIDDGLLLLIANRHTERVALKRLRVDGVPNGSADLEWNGLPLPSDIEVLEDGRVVVARGGGSVDILSSELVLSGSTSVEAGFVGGLQEITDIGSLYLTTRNGAFEIDPNAATARPVDVFNGKDWFHSALSQDGRLLATGVTGGFHVDIWSVSHGDLVARACSAVGRNLSRDEWDLYVGDLLPYRELCTEELLTAGRLDPVAGLGDGVFSVERFRRAGFACGGELRTSSGPLEVWTPGSVSSTAVLCLDGDVLEALGGDVTQEALSGLDPSVLNWNNSTLMELPPGLNRGDTGGSPAWVVAVEESGREAPSVRLFFVDQDGAYGTWLYEGTSVVVGELAHPFKGEARHILVATEDDRGSFGNLLVGAAEGAVTWWTTRDVAAHWEGSRLLHVQGEGGAGQDLAGPAGLTAQIASEVHSGAGISREAIASIALTFADRLPGACEEYWADRDWRLHYSENESAFRTGGNTLLDSDRDGYDDFSDVADLDGDGVSDGFAVFQCRVQEGNSLQGFLIVFGGDGLEVTVTPDDVRGFLRDATGVQEFRKIVPEPGAHKTSGGNLGLYWKVTHTDDRPTEIVRVELAVLGDGSLRLVTADVAEP